MDKKLVRSIRELDEAQLISDLESVLDVSGDDVEDNQQ